MTRKLLASSALVALLTAGTMGVASAQSTTTNAPANTTGTAAPARNTPVPLGHPALASTLMGASVYPNADSNSTKIGDINDVVVDPQGTVNQVVIGVGGFLGIGEKDVAVPFNQIQVLNNNGSLWIVYNKSKNELQAAPAFDRGSLRPHSTSASKAGNTGDQAAMTAAPAAGSTTETTTTTTTTTADTAPAAVPNSAFLTQSNDQLRASKVMGSTLYGPDNQNIGSVSDIIVTPAGMAQSAIVDVGGFLGVGSKKVAIPFDQIQLAMPAAVTTPTPNAATGNGTAPGAPVATSPAPATAAPTPADGTTATPPNGTPASVNTSGTAPRLTVAMTQDQLKNAPAFDQNSVAGNNNDNGASKPQAISADKLLGTKVYGSDNQNVGSVNDLIMDQKGTVQAAIVDVGGFLGIGQKSVAMQFGSLNLQTDNTGALRVSTAATQDQLKNAPTFQDNTANK
ncbi:Sporulation protein YlmC, PRC-barrel domain family [Faunimonas pinastri]|uniref:Sporulation protein YlmC, PRC-barrel domain family n=1 Tax=Faunimonas pinastri TaxID=1855383 RepID=A0A1H9DC61_9HYPH|nr:PRC-barrel domain-containing protein [Faunimonas pinastri]SEQ10949.1 Sporulation protein YlmC, PRC-barrel domain family [Faunimonas pinastri]